MTKEKSFMVEFINMENMLKQLKEHFSLKATKDLGGVGGAELLREKHRTAVWNTFHRLVISVAPGGVTPPLHKPDSAPFMTNIELL